LALVLDEQLIALDPQA